MTDTAEVTRVLAAFIAETEYASIPHEARHEVKRSLLDYIGVAVLARNHTAVETMLSVLSEVGALPPNGGGITIVGRNETANVIDASWVNGTMAHLYDFDDVHSLAGIHPGIIVIPAASSLGEWKASSGRDVLRAMAIGFEVAGRMGIGTRSTHYEDGWHSTGTIGAFGAVAAGCAVMEITTDRAQHALGIASSLAAGLRESFGSMVKSLHAGEASALGVRATLLARRSFTGPLTGIEGPRGFLAVQCREPDVAAIIDGIGTEYRFVKKGYKLYSCGGVIHPALDAAVAIHGDPEFDMAVVSDVHARVHPQVLEQMRVREPETGMQAKFCAAHAVAVGLIDGEALPPQFSDERASASEVATLRSKVRVELDGTLRRDEAVLTVALRNGMTLRHHTEHSRAYSPVNPATDEDLEDKFVSLVAPSFGEAEARSLADAIWRLESHESFADLICRLRIASA